MESKGEAVMTCRYCGSSEKHDRRVCRGRERMKRLNADPAYNPLAALTPEERADYDVLVKKGGYSRCDALSLIGRSDLVRS